jgi:hypothetical protein
MIQDLELNYRDIVQQLKHALWPRPAPPPRGLGFRDCSRRSAARWSQVIGLRLDGGGEALSAASDALREAKLALDEAKAKADRVNGALDKVGDALNALKNLVEWATSLR